MKQLIVAGVILVGCGGNPATPVDAKTPDATADAAAAGNVVHGNLGGAAFDAKDAIFTSVKAKGFDFPGMSTVILMTNFAGSCALQTSSTGTPNGHLLILVLGQTDAAGGSAPATTTGAYTIFTGTPAPSSKLAEAYWEIDGANCLKSSQAGATSGTVTVTSAADPQTGTFDLTFPNAEHVTGSFSAPSCAGLDPNRTPLGGC